MSEPVLNNKRNYHEHTILGLCWLYIFPRNLCTQTQSHLTNDLHCTNQRVPCKSTKTLHILLAMQSRTRLKSWVVTDFTPLATSQGRIRAIPPPQMHIWILKPFWGQIYQINLYTTFLESYMCTNIKHKLVSSVQPLLKQHYIKIWLGQAGIINRFVWFISTNQKRKKKGMDRNNKNIFKIYTNA